MIEKGTTNHRCRGRGHMEKRDYEDIRDRLARLRKQIADFQSVDYTHWGSIEFQRWQREVLRCMALAGPYRTRDDFKGKTNSHLIDWAMVRAFPDVEYLENQWQGCLAYADDTIGHVIENIERDWKMDESEEEKPAEAPAGSQNRHYQHQCSVKQPDCRQCP